MKRLETAQAAGANDCLVQAFPCGHKVRALPQDLGGVAFLDIETTGINRDSLITIIGIMMNGEHHTCIRGQNLDDFLFLWPKIKMLVTFNGKRFDLPMLMKEFGITCIPAHIDLLNETKAWGYTGGLKSIERRMDIARVEIPVTSGVDAISAWETYANGHDHLALQDLIAYNRQDTENLVKIVEVLRRLSWRNYPIKR